MIFNNVNRKEKFLSKRACAAVFVLMLSFTLLSVNFAVTSQLSAQIDTFLYVMVSPNPVGVGQTVYVTIQLDKLSPTAVGYAGGTTLKVSL